MYMCKTKKEFEKYFRSEILPFIKAEESKYVVNRFSVDYPMRREEWNNLIDILIKDRQLPQYAENWCAPW